MGFQQMNKIGILIIAYNAESTIESTLGRIPKDFTSNIHSILISDDNSKDLTSVKADLFAKSSSLPIQVIVQPINLGYGGNQKFGYSWAIQNDWDVVNVDEDEDSFMKDGEDDISEEDEYKEETAFVIRTINFMLPKITPKLI
jgi:glycosyltransferase involved in cell wall biosynthesis